MLQLPKSTSERSNETNDRQDKKRAVMLSLLTRATFEPTTELNMTSTATYQDIYASLGYLFYSVALSDGKVRKAEVEKLKDLIKKKWLPLEGSRDEFGTDAGHYIGISFDFANNGELSPDEAWERFVDDYKEHGSSYDATMKRLTFETAADIASVFSGNNKSELGRLSQLERLLKK